MAGLARLRQGCDGDRGFWTPERPRFPYRGEAMDEQPRITLRQLLNVMIQRGSSDLHVTTGTPPQLRIDGSLVPLRTPPLGPVESKALCYEVMTE